MRNPRPICPNEDCEHHLAPPADFYRKKGYRRPKHNRKPVPRYQCKACGTYFCATQTKAIRQHHRPDLNQQVFALAVSGVSMRRMERLLGVKVFLEVWVKVRSGWADDEARLRAYGYE